MRMKCTYNDSQLLLSTGHITTVVANHKTLVPPLLGSHPGPELLSTLKANGNRMVFVHRFVGLFLLSSAWLTVF